MKRSGYIIYNHFKNIPDYRNIWRKKIINPEELELKKDIKVFEKNIYDLFKQNKDIKVEKVVDYNERENKLKIEFKTVNIKQGDTIDYKERY